MNKNLAQSIFVLFNIIAVFAFVYVVYDYVDVNSAIRNKEDYIPFDTGTYYLLLMTIFWVLSIIQYAGLRNEDSKLVKYASQIGVYWFLLMLVLANLIPYYITSKLEVVGYKECKDPREISRTARGRSLIYIKSGECKE